LFSSPLKTIQQHFLLMTTLLWLPASFLLLAQEANTDSIEDVNLEQEQQVDINQVKFKALDNFILAGKYYPGKENYSGVLLLHDCQHDSQSYNQLAQLLSELGMHALALDFRGYGASTSDIFSHASIKESAKDITTYQTEVTRITSYWQDDTLAAYNYLRSRISKKRDVAVVSSGCSAAQAIYLAQKMRIKSFVMLTPILDYMEKEHYKNLIDIPAYFIGSAHHTNTYHTSKELFQWNGDSRSTFQTFKGIRQSNALLRSKPFLANDISLWLDSILSK